MSKLNYVLVFGALLALAYAAETEKPTPEGWPWNHNTTTVAPTTEVSTTTDKTNVTTTQLPPTTMKPNITTTDLPPNTTTEVPPTTTTAAPNTTTAAPITTPPPPITTTKPTPTPPITTTKPTPTPKPTPMPTPPPSKAADIGNWNVNFSNENRSCILAKMAMQIEIEYVTVENKNVTTYIDVPKNASGSGQCSSIAQTLTVSWDDNHVSFNFMNKSSTYGLNSIEVEIVPNALYFPGLNSSDPIKMIHKVPEYNTTSHKSYKCSQQEKKNLTSIDDFKLLTEANLIISNLQVEAFHNTTSAEGFSDAVDCIPFDTPDIVPIAAGCALAVLIIVVLLAYLLGRRRSQARGYLSM